MDRNTFRKARQKLSKSEQLRHAVCVAEQIVTEGFFQKARHLGFYLPADAELDPGLLMSLALHYGKRCYLPCIGQRIDRQRGIWMHYQYYDPSQTSLAKNLYGIYEPVQRPKERRPAHMLDLVFVPLVAFDPSTGHRLGMGKGYYDRTFDPGRLRWRRPLLVGLAHSVQEAQHIASNPWDVPLDVIVTEDRLLHFSRYTETQDGC